MSGKGCWVLSGTSTGAVARTSAFGLPCGSLAPSQCAHWDLRVSVPKTEPGEAVLPLLTGLGSHAKSLLPHSCH